MNRHGEGNTRAGVEGNQVHLAGNVFDPLSDLAGMFRSVIYSFKQDVFEGQTLARTACGAHELASRIEQCFNVPLASDGHDALADFVVWRVQRYGELRADRFVSKVKNARHDAGSRDRHP